MDSPLQDLIRQYESSVCDDPLSDMVMESAAGWVIMKSPESSMVSQLYTALLKSTLDLCSTIK